MMNAVNTIVDPDTRRIQGTRTTVYHVLDYYVHHEPVEIIADELHLTSEQVHGAIAFIEANKEFVMANYQKMLDRDARGNPPEIEAKLALSREKLQKLMTEQRHLAETCV